MDLPKEADDAVLDESDTIGEHEEAAGEPRASRRCELNSVADVKVWLRDPENHVKTQLYVVKWDGYVPYIAVAPVNRLLEQLDVNDSLAEVVLLEHMRRRRRTRPRHAGGESE